MSCQIPLPSQIPLSFHLVFQLRCLTMRQSSSSSSLSLGFKMPKQRDDGSCVVACKRKEVVNFKDVAVPRRQEF